MGKPKKRTTARRRDNRRSHLSLGLARKVNALLSKTKERVTVRTTKRESAKKK
jgi:hypothetical protein